MDEQIKRIVNRAHPELAARIHLPLLARVESISDPSIAPRLSERFRPRYAVDVQVLKANGDPDELFPVFRSVPLPVQMAGLERGAFGFPEPGTIVELAFAYGLPDRPFIRTILPEGISIPAIDPGEVLLQASPGVFQRADTAGNWRRQTDADIFDDCLNYVLECYSASETVSEFYRLVKQNSTEAVIGIKTIEALGALKLLSGGTMNLGAVDNLNITTARDHNTIAGRDYKSSVGRDRQEKVGHDVNQEIGNNLTQRIEAIMDSIAKVKQLIKVEDGGKVWLGNQSDNVLKILSDLIAVVSSIAGTAAEHTHQYPVGSGFGLTLEPVQAADFSSSKGSADGLKGTLDPIVE